MAGRARALGRLIVGHGDQLIATGMARGAAKRGKKVAFGDGTRVIWDQHSEVVFRNNPNIARPGMHRGGSVEWIGYFKGNRIYNRLSDDRSRWIWNYDFTAPRGEIFFTPGEVVKGKKFGAGFVLIEHRLPMWKSAAVNKDWGRDRYAEVARALRAQGYEVKQFSYPGDNSPALPDANVIATRDFREAMTYMANAAIYIGPEGGLHHAAAALGIKSVVIFGGFIPPEVTGYPDHVNLTGGAEACGSLNRCEHCRAALDRITIDEVAASAAQQLKAAA